MPDTDHVDAEIASAVAIAAKKLNEELSRAAAAGLFAEITEELARFPRERNQERERSVIVGLRRIITLLPARGVFNDR